MKKFTFALVLLALCSVSFYFQTKKRAPEISGKVRVKTASKTAAATAPTLGITVEKYVVNYDVNADGTAVKTWEMQQRFDSKLVIERFKKL